MCKQQASSPSARQGNRRTPRSVLTGIISPLLIGFAVTTVAGLLGGPVAAIATSVAFNAIVIARISKM